MTRLSTSKGYSGLAAVPSIGRAFLVEAPRRAPQAAATEGLYERHAAKILAYCHHQLGSREEAEDAVQTTFMNAFRALGRGVVPEAESAWLFKIAENVCLSRRRSSWRRGRIESPSDFELIEEIVPCPSRQRDELIGIEDALASMPEQQRRAILLREWQGLSYREIAEELEVSQSAVETLIFRARRSLAQGLEQPDTLKKPQKAKGRKSFRRALHVLDIGTVLAALKTVLAGSAAVKATAAAVAVTAAAGTAATVNHELESKRSEPRVAAVAKAAAPVTKVAPAEPAAVQRSIALAAPAVAAPAAAPRAEKPARTAKAKGVKAPTRRAAPRAAAPAAAATPAVVVAPVAEPVVEATVAPAPAPAPAAEEPKHEPAPAPEQAAKEEPKRSDEGKKDEGKKKDDGDKGRSTEPAPAPAPAFEQPARKGPGKAKGRGNAKHVEPPVAVVAPLPSSVTASVVQPTTEPATAPAETHGPRGIGHAELPTARRRPTSPAW